MLAGHCLPGGVVVALAVAWTVVAGVVYCAFFLDEREGFLVDEQLRVLEIVVTVLFSFQILPFVLQTFAAVAYDLRVSHPWSDTDSVVSSHLPGALQAPLASH